MQKRCAYYAAGDGTREGKSSGEVLSEPNVCLYCLLLAGNNGSQNRQI